MRTNRRVAMLSMLLFTCLALPASAADRIHAGQWEGTTIVGGTTYPMSQCMSQSDADAINGDAKAVEAYLKKITPPEICKITSVKVDGPQVIYTATCGGGAAKVVTTTYHGDRSDGTDSAGGKTVARRVGVCK
jgi:hypothetical protein